MLKPECNDHLALPKGNCVHNGGSYFFDHHRVVVLNQANLRCHLNGDVSGEFKVINLFFEPCAHIGKIACLLSILGQTALPPLSAQVRGRVVRALGFKLFFACKYVHCQLLKIRQVFFVHFIQH